MCVNCQIVISRHVASSNKALDLQFAKKIGNRFRVVSAGLDKNVKLWDTEMCSVLASRNPEQIVCFVSRMRLILHWALQCLCHVVFEFSGMALTLAW